MYTFATTGTVGFFDTTTTVDDRGGGRGSPALNMFHQPFNADVFAVDIRRAAVNHSPSGCGGIPVAITYCDTGRTVHQQIRNFGRHDVRNFSVLS